MPVPVAPTAAVAGQAARAGVQFNTLAAQVAFLLDPPSVFAFQNVSQSTATGVITSITMDSEATDTDNVHSLVTNTSRLTIVTAGRYRVVGSLLWNANATGLRAVKLLKNGVSFATTQTVANGTQLGYMQVCDEIICAVGDYLELAGVQTSGGALSTGGGSDSTFIKARWAGNT